MASMIEDWVLHPDQSDLSDRAYSAWLEIAGALSASGED